MKQFICATITPVPTSTDTLDLLAAWLGDIGFDSFSQESGSLKAYMEAKNFSSPILEAALNDFPMAAVNLHTDLTLIEGEDWNSEWEKNYFKPIVIEGQCVVHSSFHTDVPNGRYDITIDPKMAFGTGHHSTTSLMIEYLLETEVEGKTVTDMGTGTAILAILAAMRGARQVQGIEIDPDAADNARENVHLNNVEAEIHTGSAPLLAMLPPADIFLANINRNIIMADIEAYAQAMNPGAQIAVSGFYDTDIEMVVKAAEKAGLQKISQKTAPDAWSRIVFIKA